ncbi:hypothetical protein AC579_4956 [Pseudocercospora musae]|uniref:O-methyltransferase C-terminal domain-containing protein n=1 Tax=Pseudocercospora musae TaxID=113226 RepID=A0A139I6F5_9PEZI|nr:hypothetical protein AC579_4956 [Pseudocercospora musae]
MSANQGNLAYSIDHIADNFDGGGLGNGSVLDVAGGAGTVSRSLAKKFQHLNFVVQDLPDVVSAVAVDAEDMARIGFMGHDMFTPQPIKDANVYFFRRVFVEWTTRQRRQFKTSSQL